MKNFLREVRTIKRFDHPSVIKYVELFEDAKCYFIVMEEIKGLNVLSKITSTAITELDAKIIFKQIVSVINYCHNKNIIFRDLRLENF